MARAVTKSFEADSEHHRIETVVSRIPITPLKKIKKKVEIYWILISARGPSTVRWKETFRVISLDVCTTG